MKVLLLLAVVAYASASGDGYSRERSRYREVGYAKAYVYYGKYGGKCNKDGLYFRDDASFVICTNGNDVIQPCAPGTRNAKYDSYSYGDNYGANDFCAVNLVDYGYGVKPKQYGKPRAVKTVVKGYEKKQERGYSYDDNHRGYGDIHRGYGDNHRGYGDSHRGYGDSHRGYGDSHRGYGDDNGYKVRETYSRSYDDDKHDDGYDSHRGGYGGNDGYKVRESYSRSYGKNEPGYEYSRPRYEVRKGYSKGYERHGYQEGGYRRHDDGYHGNDVHERRRVVVRRYEDH